MAEEVTIGNCTLYHGDCREVLPTLPEASVQLVLVDPPYCRMKAEAWDRQWANREAYLVWLRDLANEWRRVLTLSGSLYCFASPQMAAHVEVMLGGVFQVIQRITWRKPPYSTKAEMFDKESCRMFFPASEAILFAEQYGSDRSYDAALITENTPYWTACQRLKTSLFSAPILEAMQGTGTTAKEVTEVIGAYGTVNHGGAVSNWLQGYNIPTRAHYDAMRSFFNTRNGRTDYLRREYEDLRREYEDLRRPFTISPTVPYTDVWDFATVPHGAGKHLAEKPLPLLRHMILASSRPGDTVLDCCAGSFSTLDAARECGRKGIGIEQDRLWFQRGQERLRQDTLFQVTLGEQRRGAPEQLRLMV
jgi:adenine-specific DNA-methyltransferase